jgi:hypothetical protein
MKTTHYPCDTCPWKGKNFNASTPDPKTAERHWYTTNNLKRLWEGIRQGERMICHDTDPKSKTYGNTKNVKAGYERDCVGSLILVMRSIQRLERVPFKDYRKGKGKRMTRDGAAAWCWRIATDSRLPRGVAEKDAVGVLWEDDILNDEAKKE